jgi:DNA-binding MarR family transcriptional regulator
LIHLADVLLRAGLVRVLRTTGFDLSVEAWVVLNMLWEQDRLAQLEISDRLEKDRHAISRLIDVLEAHGLAQRTLAGRDRRVKLVCLTAAGRRAEPVLRRAVAAYLEDVFEGLSQDQFDALVLGLDHVSQRLRDEAPRDGGTDA